MISVEGLTVRLGGVAVVDDVDLVVPAKGGLALWGANGAGKTTILRAILGLVPFTGNISVGGLDIRSEGLRARSLIGHVPQQLAFWDDLTARECVAFLGRLRGAAAGDADRLLERVGLGADGGKRVRSLSGGMKQRMALAAALVGDPPVLLLDEPTASLDAAGRVDFLQLLADLRTAGKTVLVTSHRLEEVRALADRAIVLDGGHVLLECAAEELQAALNSEATWPRDPHGARQAQDLREAASAEELQRSAGPRDLRGGAAPRDVPAAPVSGVTWLPEDA